MKKRIAIVIPQLTGGGAERVASNLLINLPEIKYEKYLIVFDNERIDYPYKGELISLNVKAVKHPIGKIFNFIKRIYRLKRAKKEYRIETTISLLSTANVINILSKSNDKVIISVRNYISKSSNGFYGKIYKLFIKLLYNKANLIVAVSETIKRDLVKNYGLKEEKIKVIYNPYDIERIKNLSLKPIEDKYKEIFRNPTIITMGRLSKQKGQWHLIRAFKKVKEKIYDAKLIILGQGELMDYLNKLVFNLGLENDIYFLGFQKNPFKYIARSTLFLFPSLYEGFPNALCEAMACGIPVISADCKSGPREILSSYTEIDLEATEIEYAKYGVLLPVCDGVLYNYDDPLTFQEEALSKCIINFLEDTKLQKTYSAKALKRVEDFKIENIIKIWERLI